MLRSILESQTDPKSAPKKNPFRNENRALAAARALPEPSWRLQKRPFLRFSLSECRAVVSQSGPETCLEGAQLSLRGLEGEVPQGGGGGGVFSM